MYYITSYNRTDFKYFEYKFQLQNGFDHLWDFSYLQLTDQPTKKKYPPNKQANKTQNKTTITKPKTNRPTNQKSLQPTLSAF